MRNRKLIVKISYGLIAALVLVLVSLLIYQKKLIKQMSENGHAAQQIELASDSSTRYAEENQTTPLAGRDPDQLLGKKPVGNDSLKYHIEAAEEELEMIREDLANEIDKNALTEEFVEMYEVFVGYNLLQEIVNESKKAMQIYYNDTPEKAIDALLVYRDILEGELENFDDNSEKGFIDRSTITFDLSLVYGRVSIKYLELDDSGGYKENIHKALFYIKQRSEKAPTEDEFIQFIKRIDENYLKKNKD